MEVEEIKKTAVIGAGNMGSQIAGLLSRVGKYEVNLVDVNDEFVRRGLKSIKSGLKKFYLEKGKITKGEIEAILTRIRGFVDFEKAVEDVQFVIEAVPEILDLKCKTFQRIDKSAPKNAVLASNTSMLNITEIASATNNPSRVVGMHFFNPVAVMKLVEVVKGSQSSDKAVKLAVTLSKRLGKEPVVCRDTSYGFLANRVYEALREEALQVVWEKVASPEDVDKALKLGYNLPLGPLEMGDMLGSWKRRHEMEKDRIRELGEKGRLHPLIKTMVRAGYYGGPGEKGIYDFWREVISKW